MGVVKWRKCPKWGIVFVCVRVHLCGPCGVCETVHSHRTRTTHLQAGVAAVLPLRPEGKSTVRAFVDVAMAQQQRSHDDRLIILVDQLINDRFGEETKSKERKEKNTFD